MLVSALSFVLVNSHYGFTSPLQVAESERLAMTPKIDGRLEPSEWDVFTLQGERATYLQWEPGKVHVAGNLEEGQDLLISMDLAADGWLVGKDNYECRITWQESRPVWTIRKLDATKAEGPTWVHLPLLDQVADVKAEKGGSGWIVEASLSDAGMNILPNDPMKKIGLRVDPIPAADTYEAFQPRTMVNSSLVFDRGSMVPGGLKWKTQYVTRTVAPGNKIRIRLTFNGQDELGLNRIEMQTKGFGIANTADIGLPFPGFDRKGRAFVDYNTPIPAGTESGYRLLNAVVTDAQGNSAFLRTSFKVAPLVEIDFSTPRKIPFKAETQKLRLSFHLRSSSQKRVEGSTEIRIPEGWQLLTGDDKKFIIANAYGSVRRVFDVTVPANTTGSYPIKIVADVAGKPFEQTAWLHFGEPQPNGNR